MSTQDEATNGASASDNITPLPIAPVNSAATGTQTVLTALPAVGTTSDPPAPEVTTPSPLQA